MRRPWIAALAALLVCLVVLGFVLSQQTTAPRAGDATTAAGLGLMLLDEPGGVSVLAVTERSAAYRAGVLPGDVLLRADGQPLPSAAELEQFLALDPLRTRLQLELLRNGAPLSITLRCK